MGIREKYDAFLSLVRLGIGHSFNAILKEYDWDWIQAFAEEQGLSAIVLDGIERLPDNNRPPQALLLEWIGEVLQGYEYRYDAYKKALAELAGFYNAHGFKMMVLKGYACSLDWPKPEHRPCGDIDIWQFGQQEEADNILVKEKKIIVEKNQHHHTIFNWNDFMVENHYDFVNVHSHKSSRELEKVFKELGADDSHFVELWDASTGSATKVYLPSPNLHALFLIRHAASHFAAEGINLRQVLDWAFFVKKHTKEIDWPWLVSILEKYHMRDFFNCINAICIEEFGFSVDIFSSVQFGPQLKERVLNDILQPKYQREPPVHLISRLRFKYNRWRDSEWKRRLCYQESGWNSLLTSMWAHLLKPNTI